MWGLLLRASSPPHGWEYRTTSHCSQLLLATSGLVKLSGQVVEAGTMTRNGDRQAEEVGAFREGNEGTLT